MTNSIGHSDSQFHFYINNKAEMASVEARKKPVA